MSRIDLMDSTASAIKKMSDGNPGAIAAMVELLKEGKAIDPQSAFGGLSGILSLDTYEIYGTDIYILYSDKCGKDVRQMLMILRATQLGIFPRSKLQEMAHDQMREINLTEEEWKEFDSKVCKRLPEFAKPVEKK